MGSMKSLQGSLFLKELLKGMSVTGQVFLRSKDYRQYPEEKRRKTSVSADCMPCVVIRKR